MNSLINNVWVFTRGEIETNDFEQWVYRSPELEQLFGSHLYYLIVNCDYRDRNKVWELKQLLKNSIDQIDPRQCSCITWKDYDIVPICDNSGWETIFKYLHEIKKRTPWLDLKQCKYCGQFWYVGSDTIDDAYYLYRLKPMEVEGINSNNVWPVIFDQMKAMWPSIKWLINAGYKSLDEWQKSNNITA